MTMSGYVNGLHIMVGGLVWGFGLVRLSLVGLVWGLLGHG